MAGNQTQTDPSEAQRVCPWQRVRTFDNVLRPLIHNPRTVFGPHVRAGMTVLDVGCGRGFASLAMARLVGASGRVIAADLQDEMLAMVGERAEKAGVAGRIELHRCARDRIGVEPGASGPAVDFALAFWMAHEVPDPAAFFGELRRIVRPGGRLLVVEPWGHVSSARFEAEIAVATVAGFTEVDRPRVLFSRAVVLEAPGEDA